MKKFSTAFMVFAFIAAISLLAGCNGSPNGDTAYDSTYYNVPMKDALRASQSFVKESVKATPRSAFVNLEEEDTWQGYITNQYGNNWNVPSSIYGTSLTTADNELIINGEKLGTLQELVFHKDEQGHFTKAVFEYKGQLYYVMDDPDGRFVILSSEDDYDHIFFTQDGKAFTKDWSNFKIWIWEKDGDGKLYRNGNLGYAYTLRNVQMLDGSYATVTVSGFCYYYYGFRVWIEETDGNTVKKPYPGDPNPQPNPVFQEDGYIELDLSIIAEKIKDCDSAHIQRCVKGSDEWDTVMYYYAENGKKLDTTVKLVDYYTDKGIEYSYKMNAWGGNAQNPIDLGTYKAEKGLGDLKFISGAATYDETEHALVFTKIPSFEPEINIGEFYPSFQLRYCLDENNYNGWIYFNLTDIKNNKLPIEKAYEIEKYLGKKMIPAAEWYQTAHRITEDCIICWRAETDLVGKETLYPSFTVPANKEDFMDN